MANENLLVDISKNSMIFFFANSTPFAQGSNSSPFIRDRSFRVLRTYLGTTEMFLEVGPFFLLRFFLKDRRNLKSTKLPIHIKMGKTYYGLQKVREPYPSPSEIRAPLSGGIFMSFSSMLLVHVSPLPSLKE